MKAMRKTRGQHTHFIVTEVEPGYHEVLRGLYYTPVKEGFAKAFQSDTPGLDRIYHSFELHVEEMVLQTADDRPVPWEQCLLAYLKATEGHDIDWFLGGSGALAVRGLEIVPRDLDLVVGDPDSVRLADILSEHLVEPHVRVEDWFCNWFARAFIHARLEWVGGVDERGDRPEVSDFGPAARGRLDTVSWRGFPVRVPPLDLQLAVNRRRGLADRVTMIEQAMSPGRRS
jgi:hypothetical protein